MKKNLLYPVSIFLFLLFGCEQENLITDLDPCKNIFYDGFTSISKKSLNTTYYFEKSKDNDNWIVCRVEDRNSSGYQWLVYNKTEKTFKKFTSAPYVYGFELNNDQIIYNTELQKLETLDLYTGSTLLLYNVPDKENHRLNDFVVKNQQVDLIIQDSEKLKHYILSLHLENQSVDTLWVTDKIEGTDKSYLFDEFVMPYQNESGQPCLVIFYDNNKENTLYAYSVNLETQKEEYHENLGNIVETPTLKRSLSIHQTFCFLKNGNNSFIYNFQTNKKFPISLDCTFSGPYVLSSDGTIYQGATGQVIQQYQTPKNYFTSFYFDHENNRIFYEQNGKLGILKLDLGCKSKETPYYHFNLFVDFTRKELYSFQFDNEKHFFNVFTFE